MNTVSAVSVEPAQSFDRSTLQLIAKYKLTTLKLTFILLVFYTRSIPFRVIDGGLWSPSQHAPGRESPRTGCQFIAWPKVDVGGQYEYKVAFPNPRFSMLEKRKNLMI